MLSSDEIYLAFRGYNLHASPAVKESIAKTIIEYATPLIDKKIQTKELGDGILLLKGKTGTFGFGCDLPVDFRDYRGECFLSGLSPKELALFPNVKFEYGLLSVNRAWTEFRKNRKFYDILQNYSIIAREVVDPAFRAVFPEPVARIEDDNTIVYKNKKVIPVEASINTLRMLLDAGLFEEDSAAGFKTYKGENMKTGDPRDWENYNKEGFSKKGYAISCKGEGDCFVVEPIDPDYVSNRIVTVFGKRQ